VTHQDIIDRVAMLNRERVDAVERARREAYAAQAAERERMQAACGALGHAFARDGITWLMAGETTPRGCLVCGAQETGPAKGER
jgi:hypothetical protein